ncbi:MAG: lipid-A-disaccharide synthase [Terrimonas sp.]|nr:lipid-A-disaccharide synthase [Terrimonas sp.]
MKYYIIAGEASGDLHGSNLIKELLKLDPSATIRCWGGDLMQATGAELVKHYKELAFMGFWEVLKNISTILDNLRFCKKDIQLHKPDTLVLIDYPGFNLRIAKWAKQQGYRVIYYISPQVWAWKENRVEMMKQCIDKMLVILPFEKEYYREKWDWEVEYVGHPLVEVMQQKQLTVSEITGPNNIVALLPGSRKQEILKKLPLMLSVARYFTGYQFIVAKAPGIDDDFYDAMLKNHDNVSAVSNRTYDILLQAKAALVTSGTATLETALLGVPEVVCYKGSFLSYQIGKRLVKVKYISLVNLIMDKMVVRELIQDDLNTENLKKALSDILNDTEIIAALKKDYARLKELLSVGGNASANAAASIQKFLQKN